jgi:hypothetical protein
MGIDRLAPPVAPLSWCYRFLNNIRGLSMLFGVAPLHRDYSLSLYDGANKKSGITV